MEDVCIEGVIWLLGKYTGCSQGGFLCVAQGWGSFVNSGVRTELRERVP